MRKEQRRRAGLKIDNVNRVRPVAAGHFDAQKVYSDCIKQWRGLIALRDDDVDLALKGRCVSRGRYRQN